MTSNQKNGKRLHNWAILFLIALLVCLAGCSQKQAQPTLSVPEQQEICDDSLDLLKKELSLPEEMAQELVPQRVERYEQETLVRYSQVYKGVEVFGSSIVVASGEEDLCMGTCYDFSQAFGENFQDQVAQARTVPDWMTDQRSDTGSLHYLTDTLTPVIYVLPDDTAVIARQVDALYHSAAGTAEYTLVLSLDGSTLYTMQDYSMGFTDASVTGPGGDTYTAAKENDTYYAYDQEMNFYIYDRSESDALSYITSKGAEVDSKLMYGSASPDWSSGKSKRVYDAMTAFGSVARWYRDLLGYNGIDGKGGAAMVVLNSGTGVSVAANGHKYGYVTYLYTTKKGYTAVDAPEILAHEYGHAVLKNTYERTEWGQPEALCEAICDVFGACYQKDWHLAAIMADTGDDKNIPATKYRTMDDYVYDDLDDYGEVVRDEIDNDFYSFLYEIYDHTFFFGAVGMVDDYITMTSDAYHYYENSYIISYTLYRIWDRCLDRNYDMLATILMNSLKYLPSDADFLSFRCAFLRAAKMIYGSETVAPASTCFDAAGIKYEKTAKMVNVGTSKDRTDFPWSLLMDMDYEQIGKLVWDTQYTLELSTGDPQAGPQWWQFEGTKGSAGVSILFRGALFDSKSIPTNLLVEDYSGGADALEILQGVATGMTYSEIRQVLPQMLDPVEDYMEIWDLYAMCPMENWLLELYFTGDGENAVLTQAVLTVMAA